MVPEVYFQFIQWLNVNWRASALQEWPCALISWGLIILLLTTPQPHTEVGWMFLQARDNRTSSLKQCWSNPGTQAIDVQARKQRIVWNVIWLDWCDLWRKHHELWTNMLAGRMAAADTQSGSWAKLLPTTAVIRSFKSRSGFRNTLKQCLCSFVHHLIKHASLFLAVSNQKIYFIPVSIIHNKQFRNVCLMFYQAGIYSDYGDNQCVKFILHQAAAVAFSSLHHHCCSLTSLCSCR